MKNAVDRTYQSILRKEIIGIFGDYDVDGATSTALLNKYFMLINQKTYTHIPDRKNEGYGPSISGFDKIISFGAKIIFTVDCGTLSFEPVSLAQKSNIDVIILDHHQSDINIPKACAVINPNRHDDNSSLIQVSRKTAQLLRFYKDKIAKVRIEILSDPSKQMKIVTESMNEINFNNTIDSAPTETVSISDIDSTKIESNKNEIIEEPIEIGFEQVSDKDLLLKVYEFQSYNEAKSIFAEFNLNYKFVIQKEEELYSLIVGPLNNDEANKLVLSFISKGYKKTEFILE